MASFIYFYSKFTEEFLLLTSAGIFTLLSVYCYHWFIKRRLLGAARDQLPAGVVKVYLNQLINEAQGVRNQLFGIMGGANAAPMSPQLMAQFQASQAAMGGSMPAATASGGTEGISPDLLARLKALEGQLSEKESMVVNINIEKTKLLEEIENLKQNQKAVGSGAGAAAGNQDDLLSKIKNLEERLEEYALFEDDLANLKRLQQENNQLKKRIEEGNLGAAPAAAAATPGAAPAAKPAGEMPADPIAPNAEKDAAGVSLDQEAINKLLNGIPATPPEVPAVNAAAALAPASLAAAVDAAPAAPEAAAVSNVSPIHASPAAEATPAAETPATAAPLPATAAPAAPALAAVPTPPPAEAKAPPAQVAGTDEFEKLVDKVETSLDQAPAAPKAEAAPEAPKDEALAAKSDEELLKEFENLLNS